MLQVLKRGLKNERFRVENRPTDIVGSSIVERFRHIKKINREAGELVGKEAKNLKGKEVDISAPTESFSKKLDDFGVGLVDDGKAGFKADFKETSLAPGDRGPIKEVIRQMNRLGKKGEPDGFAAHELKRIIDRNVTFGKVKTGLSGDAERALKELRSGLNTVLGEASPAYKKANKRFSETIDALDRLSTAVGRNVDLFGERADKSVGTQSRRLLANVQSRVPMIDAIKDLETIAANTGAKFKDDIITQAMFADELDRMFGAPARTSFKGQIEQAVQKGSRAATSAAGAGSEAIGIAAKLSERARGINKENAIKSIEALLAR